MFFVAVVMAVVCHPLLLPWQQGIAIALLDVQGWLHCYGALYFCFFAFQQPWNYFTINLPIYLFPPLHVNPATEKYRTSGHILSITFNKFTGGGKEAVRQCN